MKYGPGASAPIWPTLFPAGEVWFAEFNETCINSYWNEAMPWKFVASDQANRSDLARWMRQPGGQFDFIIDDGGHTNVQIWVLFDFHFESALKPGGTYSIEDLQVSDRIPWYFGGVLEAKGKTMVDILLGWISQLLTFGDWKGFLHGRNFEFRAPFKLPS